MIESLLVILVLCLLFFGLLQVALVFQADEILHHSAARAARSRAVGFNDWMAVKAQRVAAIPNSGALLEPVLGTPLPVFDDTMSPGEKWDSAIDPARTYQRSDKAAMELARIPFYLASENHLRGQGILDYEEWQNHAFDVSVQSANPLATSLGGAGTIRGTVRQRYPLWMPFHRLFYRPEPDAEGTDRVTLSGESEILDHASLYLAP